MGTDTGPGVAPPPPGVTPDFSPSSGHLQSANVVVASVGIGMSTACLLMRIWTKAWLLRKFGFDDWLIILAWALSISSQAILLYGYFHSLYGVHIWDFTVARLALYQKTLLAASVLYIPALGLAKFGILVLYYFLLSTVTIIWKYIIYAAAFIIFGYSISFVLAIIFACSPIEKGWDPTITTGSCINIKAIYLATVITNTASDVVLIIIAIPIVRKLHLPFLQRVGVISMFGIGCLTIITSIVRLATFWPFLTSKDPTYKIALIILLVFIEGNFIILCVTLPYLRYFIRHYAPRWFGESSEARKNSSNESSLKRMWKRSKPGHSQEQDDVERASAAARTTGNSASEEG